MTGFWQRGLKLWSDNDDDDDDGDNSGEDEDEDRDKHQRQAPSPAECPTLPADSLKRCVETVVNSSDAQKSWLRNSIGSILSILSILNFCIPK